MGRLKLRSGTGRGADKSSPAGRMVMCGQHDMRAILDNEEVFFCVFFIRSRGFNSKGKY